MVSMIFSTRQSELNELTDKLEKFSALVDLYNEGRTTKELLLSELSYFENMDWSRENLFNQLLAYNVFASAYGILKQQTLDFTKAYYNNEYVYKEISYYHNILYVVTRVRKEQWSALYWTAYKMWCRAYLYLANICDHIGRFCEAQQYYHLAAMDKECVAEVEINQGYSYANMHAFWKEEEPWIVKRAQMLMNKHARVFDKKCLELKNAVCSWPVPSFEVPKDNFMQKENGAYELWVNDNYLRLNRFCDVDPHSKLSVLDNVKLQKINDSEERQGLFNSSFDEIKEMFVETRKIAFTIVNDGGEVNKELLKMTYKNFYSIFDKIAVFLQAYMNLPIEVHRVDFAKIWYDKKNVIRHEFLVHSQNLSLLALYNIHLDVYGSKIFEYLIDVQTKDLQRIRNFLEHKMVVVREGEMEYDDYQLRISKDELILNTIRLAQLVRCAIIYLCNFVMHAEYDKHLKVNFADNRW